MCENFPSSYRMVNKVRLHYKKGGKGPPILLICGWPQTWRSWIKVMPQLAENYTVIAVDPRGLGESSRPIEGYDVNNVAQDLHELMQALGYRQYYVVGHDVGMWIGYALAASYREEVKKIALLDARIPGLDPLQAWHFAFNQLADLPEILIQGKEEAFLTWFFENYAHRPGKIAAEEYIRAYSKPGALRAGFAYYRAIPQSAAQNRHHAKNPLHMPVLTLGGEYARGMDLKNMLAPVTTNLQADMILNCGHYIPEECPDELMEKLIPFLKNSP